MDSVKSFLSKKPIKKKVQFAVLPPKPTPASSNKKAGDKIVKIHLHVKQIRGKKSIIECYKLCLDLVKNNTINKIK